MVRVGIGTYGIWPSRETQLAARERGSRLSLAPVLTWKTRVAQVKEVKAGDYVGYGLTFRASRPMKLVVLPIGYYDGYDRKLSNSGRALIHGQPASVVGRVAMNMTMLDVTDIGAELDDEVVLIGRQGNAEIRVEELAEKIGTIPYEVRGQDQSLDLESARLRKRDQPLSTWMRDEWPLCLFVANLFFLQSSALSDTFPGNKSADVRLGGLPRCPLHLERSGGRRPRRSAPSGTPSWRASSAAAACRALPSK